MTTPKQLISRASKILNDDKPGYENTSWSVECLLDFLNEGLCQLAAYRPTEFVECIEPMVRTSQADGGRWCERRPCTHHELG